MKIEISRNIFRGELMKVLSLTAIANFLKIIANLISSKIIAILIGPQGIAVTGQFVNLLNVITTFSTGGINNGTIKYISEYKNDETKYYSIVNSALVITFIFSLITSLALIIFSRNICLFLFSDLTFISIIYITSATIGLYSINGFLLSVINGMKLYNKFIVINLISSIAALVLTIFLVYFFKVYGALLALATYQSIIVIITIVAVKKNKLLLLKKINFRYSKTTGKLLFSFTITAFIGIIWPSINIIIRTSIISNISFESAGIWEGMTKISGLIVAIIGTTITTYYLPHLSAINNEQELSKEIKSGMKLLLSITLIILLILFIFKYSIINLLYTKQFSSMSELFLFQLFGDFFWVAKMTLSVNLLAKAMVRKYFIIELCFGLLYLSLALALIKLGFGIKGVPIAHFIYNFIYFITMIFIFRKLLFVKKT